MLPSAAAYAAVKYRAISCQQGVAKQPHVRVDEKAPVAIFPKDSHLEILRIAVGGARNCVLTTCGGLKSQRPLVQAPSLYKPSVHAIAHFC